LFRWNDDEEWNDGDQVILRPDLEDHSDMESNDDMLYLRTDYEPFTRRVCEAVGLTAGPVFDEDD
jgi:phytoene/squalene synthetase